MPAVRQAITDTFKRDRVDVVICSAACGADLLALDVAITLGIRCRVVLPFTPEEFRRTSVVDRPGDWGPLYDRIIASVRAAGGLVVLGAHPADDHSYSLANEAIIEMANFEADGGRRIAVLIWEGRSHHEPDATAEFRKLAVAAGMEERVILTCDE